MHVAVDFREATPGLSSVPKGYLGYLKVSRTHFENCTDKCFILRTDKQIFLR